MPRAQRAAIRGVGIVRAARGTGADGAVRELQAVGCTGAARGKRPRHTARGVGPRCAARLIWTGFAAGLLLVALLVARSQVGGDQLNLLARGWLLAVHGHMVWTGNPLSTGGNAPGGLTSLLVGLPLMLWRDHRAATALVALCHLLAYLLLDRTLARILSPQERLCFMLLYWLSPWQLYFAGFLWNPNYLFLGGAIHLATAWRLRGRRPPRSASVAVDPTPHGPGTAADAAPSPGASLLHAATLVLGFQIHPSFLLLAAASALLWWRGYIRLHLRAALAGAVLGALPLLPWAVQAAAHPALLTAAHKGFPGRGLLFSLPRGLYYWLRYSSLAVAGRTSLFDFTEAFGAAANRRLAPPLRALTEIIGPLSVLLPLAANLWLARRWWRQTTPAPAPATAVPAPRAAPAAAALPPAASALSPISPVLPPAVPTAAPMPLSATLVAAPAPLPATPGAAAARLPFRVWSARVADFTARLLPSAHAHPALLACPDQASSRPRPAAGGRAWLRAYVVATLLAAAAVYALSPTTLMYWQGLCLFHAAVLPLTLCAGALLRTRHARRVLAAAAFYAALEVLLTLGIAFGTPDFRCRGLGTLVFPLRDHSRMLDDLHIQSTCPWPLDVPGTWWPDVLPPSAGH
jgi:hypothetical protein